MDAIDQGSGCTLDYIIELEPSALPLKCIRAIEKIAKQHGLITGGVWDLKVVLKTTQSTILSGRTTKDGYESVYRCQVSCIDGKYTEMTPAKSPQGLESCIRSIALSSY